MMTIFELGALGEFISAVVVVITLVYLAIQIRQNTKWTKATVRHQLADFSQDAYALFAQHSFAIAKYYAGDELTPAERLEATSVVYAMFRNWDNYRWQFEEGLLDKETWDGILVDIEKSAAVPAIVDCWQRTRMSYPKSLQQVIDPTFIRNAM